MVYRYRCQKCGIFELEQKISEDALSKCPTCGNDVYRIVTGGAGIIYNASGFTKKPTKLSQLE